ncbi:putative oxidoreductase [Frigoribacterium sp. PhB160]|uniref:DoxX family protein n=1 Tax=Frigoribacterium sp. PhB160 TaxID=2485192 RepID=UPI000F498F0B|nr:DoxX family protein [Frigoribacterium sp. PhB160]ROS62580.1 putative oxidoreductase [Frigoribacterium sp. PhB160]
MTFGLSLLRVAVGGALTAHGLQKLRGSFDGPGLEGTAQMMAGTGMHPPRRNAQAVAWTETAGGAALVLGAATPLAAAGAVAVMTTAIRKVHLPNGFFAQGGGWELNAIVIAAAAAIASGPGGGSVDQAFGKKAWGTGGALFALVAGVIGSTVAIELGRRAAPADDAAADDAAAGSSDGDAA